MSAVPHLRLTGSFDEQVERGPKWLPLDEASERSELSVGQLRRKCQEWEHTGHARQETPPGGGKARWVVREDADPRLAPVKSVKQLNDAFDLRALSAKHRRELLFREQAVQGWDEARAAGTKLGWTETEVTNHYVSRLQLEHDRKVSRRTLYEWRKAYRQEGRAGLVAATWKTSAEEAKPSLEDEPFFELVKRLYLSDKKRSVAWCVHQATYEGELQGWKTYSERHVRRELKKIPRATVVEKREGKKALDDKLTPYQQRDYSQIESNDIWCADHHRLDVIVLHEGKPVRPWLTAWQDLRSRMIVGWQIFAHDPNSDVILGSFRAGVQQFGVPRGVYIDNGKDYDASALQGMTKRQRQQMHDKLGDAATAVDQRAVFPALGIDVAHARPYNAKAKPIERFFRTVKDRFSKCYDGYTGGTTAEKPETLAKHIKAGHLVTLAELQGDFAEWVEGDYHDRAHLGDGVDGRTPRQTFAAELVTKRTCDVKLLDYLCCRRFGPVRVGRHGVRMDGVNYGQHEVRLMRMQGESVMLVVDERDVSKVIVEQLDGKIIGEAAANKRLSPNTPKQDLREASASIRKTTRAIKEAQKQRPTAADDPADRMRRMAAERRRKAAEAQARNDRLDPPPAPGLQPVGTRTAADHQDFQRRLDEASKGRRAVGAESFDPTLMDQVFGRRAEGAEFEDGTDASREDVDLLSLLARAARSQGDENA